MTFREFCSPQRVEKLIRIAQLSPLVDICLSHDWPQSIERHGDYKDLIRRRSHLRADCEAGKLGSPPLLEVLNKVRPSQWFAGHMHVKFEATVKHEGPATVTTTGIPPGARETKFLALDQCLPNRDYLEIIDFPAPPNSSRLTFDAEWLGIVRATHQYFSRTTRQQPLPPDSVLRPFIEESIRWVKDNVGENKDITEVQAFTATAPGPDPAFNGYALPQRESYLPSFGKIPAVECVRVTAISYTNPQTVAFCEMLGIPNQIN
ncbi:hypothetical protein FRC00_006983 [Tulasnella sp. 408]|nr:hypothetical protein FRC00_006983 [Tulasnella sp. 408]